MKIYESVIDIVQGEATMLFVNLSYTLATEEAERIGVDHVVRTSTHENGGKSAGKAYLLATVFARFIYFAHQTDDSIKIPSFQLLSI